MPTSPPPPQNYQSKIYAICSFCNKTFTANANSGYNTDINWADPENPGEYPCCQKCWNLLQVYGELMWIVIEALRKARDADTYHLTIVPNLVITNLELEIRLLEVE